MRAGMTMGLDPAVTHKTAEARGTMIFMPPETFDGAAVSFAHDIYSLGIIRAQGGDCRARRQTVWRGSCCLAGLGMRQPSRCWKSPFD